MARRVRKDLVTVTGSRIVVTVVATLLLVRIIMKVAISCLLYQHYQTCRQNPLYQYYRMVLQDDHNLSAFFRASTKMSAFPFESHAKGAPKVFEGNYWTVKLWLMKSDILFKQHNLALKLYCELLLNWTSEEEQTVIKGC
jgi:hypothetical protein